MCILCGLVDLALLFIMASQRYGDNESGTLPWALTVRHDIAAVIVYDSVSDRHAKPGSLPAASTSKERLEEILLYFFRHPAAVVFYRQRCGFRICF